MKRLYIAACLLALPFLSVSGAACTDGGSGESLSQGVIAYPPCKGDSCEPRDVSTQGLILGDGSTPTHDEIVGAASVEEVLEKGLLLGEYSPIHIAIRGTTQSNSIRCDWKGLAMTLEQRERQVRFWLGMDDDEALPSAQEIEAEFLSFIDGIAPQHQEYVSANFLPIVRGGLSTDIFTLGCYVDYSVGEYLLGAGPGVLTVAYDQMGSSRSYDLLRRGHEAGEFGSDPLINEAEHVDFVEKQVQEAEARLSQILEGRESVVFLAPMGAHSSIAVEAWQAVAQWDLQELDTNTVMAVRNGTYPSDPEHTQALEELKERIATAAASDSFASKRIENVGGLTQYYRDIGAYADITPDDGSTTTFVPAQPPPVKKR